MTATTTRDQIPNHLGQTCETGHRVKLDQSRVRMFTDGACLWTHGPGGAAAVFIDGNGTWQQRVWGIECCTNNQAELIAVIEGLSHLPAECRVIVFTDSQYVIDCTQRLSRWVKDGWVNRGRRGTKRIANVYYLKSLHRLIRRRNVTFKRVAAHAGIRGNELADRIAYLAASFTYGLPGNSTQQNVLSICSHTGDDVPLSLAGLDDVQLTPPTDPLYLDTRYLPNIKKTERRKFNIYYGWRRGARISPVDVHDPWGIPVGAHRGNHRDFLGRYVRAAQAATEELHSQSLSRKATTFFNKLFDYSTDFRMLRCSFDLAAQSGSIASGVDGRTIDDLAHDRFTLTSILKWLETGLRNNTYHPQELRRVYIPKPGNRGNRAIDIPTIEDRIVDRALLITLAPLLEPKWHACNIGFRTGHGPQHGLAMVDWHLRKGGYTTVLTLDIHKAFTCLPKGRLAHAVRKAVPRGTPKQLTRLVETIIRRPLPDGPNVRTSRGVAQGSPLSPILLNVYLDQHLDHQWDHQRWPMVRYADDIIVLAKSRLEWDAALRALENLLRPNGLTLRDKTPEMTCGDRANWLGLALTGDGKRMRTDLSEAAWDRLEDGLRYALSVDGPSRTVTRQVLSGWLDYAGPAYRRGRRYKSFREQFVDRVATKLTKVGRMEGHRMPPRVIHHAWATSGVRWRKRRRRVQDRLDRTCWANLTPRQQAQPDKQSTRTR